MLTIVVGLALGLAVGAEPAEAPGWRRIVDYGSRWSRKRPVRPQTRYIVLHTTEGAERGSLAKLSRDGEAHYLVGQDGSVFRIVDRTKIATHAGRSMWEGRVNLDEHAVGVEVVGYHDRVPGRRQLAALKELIRQLQSLYNVPDERVLTHSMVAYGRPNRWHRKRHRGRKRCAMSLAEPQVREALGLDGRVKEDPDVRAGRLMVADRDLFAALYVKDRQRTTTGKSTQPKPKTATGDPFVVSQDRSPWDIARENYASSRVLYHFPDGRTLRGSEIKDWTRMPPGTRVDLTPASNEKSSDFDGFATVGRDGKSPKAIAGAEHRAETTIYFFPSGLVRTGAQLAGDRRFRFLLSDAPTGTRVLVGYRYGGYVTAHRPPSVICGTRWNYPSTFYRFPDGKIRSGDEVDAVHIPKNTLVFFQS